MRRVWEVADDTLYKRKTSPADLFLQDLQLSLIHISHDIHCHHKVPVSNGGSDEYANLILVSKAVHILIHASSELTIEKYLKSLNLDNKQIEKLNKLRIMAEMPPIIL